MSNKNPEVAVEIICGQFIYLFHAFKFRILARSGPEISPDGQYGPPFQIRVLDLRHGGIEFARQ